MKILADENIAQVEQAFAGFGELHTVPGRSITPELMRDVDVLLVRSVTAVNSSLLAASPCRFVATATSGIEHVDTQWLQAQGIGFAHALGSNADSVVDYVLSACAFLSQQVQQDWRRLSFGIIGCGEVGGRLARRLQALGVTFRIHDPFLTAAHPLAASFCELDAVLQQDLVSLHAPLTRTGPWPTWHMLDERRLAQLRPETILINAARGEIADSSALLARLERYPQSRAVIDAWEGEPLIDARLLHKAILSTAHIAGHSRLAKLRGTAMIQQAFCKYFALQCPQHDFSALRTELVVESQAEEEWQELNRVLLSAYDIGRDHQAMQELLGKENSGANFDRLRRNYQQRAEFSQLHIVGSRLPDSLLAALGFQTVPTV